MRRLRLSFGGWDLASETRWECAKRASRVRTGLLRDAMCAWARRKRACDAGLDGFELAVRRFGGFWLSGWKRETQLMSRVRDLGERVGGREMGERAGEGFDLWKESYLIGTGERISQVVIPAQSHPSFIRARTP